MASIVIGISDMNVAKGNDSVITYALGSCVGVALYDGAKKIAGLAHIMMPSSTEIIDRNINVMKYADTAIPELIKRMERVGASSFNLTAKIAGGAEMFSMAGAGNKFNIGERNIAAVKAALQKARIRIVAHDVGANYGRTVEVFAANGLYRIKAISKGIKEI